MADRVSYQGGAGLPGLLLVLFIGLKLTGHIAWSWVWVLSPVWITLAVALVIAVTVTVVAAKRGEF